MIFIEGVNYQKGEFFSQMELTSNGGIYGPLLVGLETDVLEETNDIYAMPLIAMPYPSIFSNTPIEGEISINRQFEEHPSSSFELETTLHKSDLQRIFAPGLELDIYGIPFRINNINITELPRSLYPGGRNKISVSLGGKWENYLDNPVFLRPDGKNLTEGNSLFQDPDCINQNGLNNKNPNTSTTIYQLLSKLNIPYNGINLKIVNIDSNTPRDAVANVSSLLNDRVRIANGFVRYSNSQGLEVINLDGGNYWFYQESEILGEIQTSYDAISKRSKQGLISSNINPPHPDFVNFPADITPAPLLPARTEVDTNLSFEYPNVELTGQFNQPKENNSERTQGQSQPRYVRKPPLRETRIDGDKDAHLPLVGVSLVQVMSLCHDIGGQTKTRSTTITEDGADISIINEIWGFAFTAIQIYDAATGKLKGNPSECWVCLKRVVTQYTYEQNTGYLLYITESGYNTVRYKKESADKPETLALEFDDPELPLYSFLRIPVINRTSYSLRLMPSYSTEGLYELVKTCNRDGTSSLTPLINPNFAFPYYVELERTESFSFASRSNPENEGLTIAAGDKPFPDLVVGEESAFEARTEIIPATYEEIYSGSEGKTPIMIQGRELSPQKWVKYIKKFKAQGESIAEAVTEISIEKGTGDPPTAQKRPPVYDRVQDASSGSGNSDNKQNKFKYLIQTEGYTSSDPVGGSESYAEASTLEEALVAAKCKLAIENWRLGFQEQFQIPCNLRIKEGDKLVYVCNGETRRRVVLGVSHSLKILGITDTPKIMGITSLTLGRWILPNLTYSKIPIPEEPKAPQQNIDILSVVSQTLGGIVDWNLYRSRRNP